MFLHLKSGLMVRDGKNRQRSAFMCRMLYAGRECGDIVRSPLGVRVQESSRMPKTVGCHELDVGQNLSAWGNSWGR